MFYPQYTNPIETLHDLPVMGMLHLIQCQECHLHHIVFTAPASGYWVSLHKDTSTSKWTWLDGTPVFDNGLIELSNQDSIHIHAYLAMDMKLSASTADILKLGFCEIELGKSGTIMFMSLAIYRTFLITNLSFF